MGSQHYYPHGGLAEERRDVHKAIFSSLLAHPHGAAEHLALIDMAQNKLPVLRNPDKKDKRRDVIHEEIQALRIRGLLESFEAHYASRGNGRIRLDPVPGAQPLVPHQFIRVSPAALGEVGKLLGKKK